MRYLLSIVVALLFVGCGQEQAPRAQEDTPRTEAKLEPVTVKAEQQARKQMALMTVNEAVQGFRVMQRRLPENLSELTDKGLLAALPELPAGMSFTYDPEAGEVGIVENNRTE